MTKKENGMNWQNKVRMCLVDRSIQSSAVLEIL